MSDDSSPRVTGRGQDGGGEASPPPESIESAPRPVLYSILPRWLRRVLVAGLALAAFMLANTLYLLANRLADALGWEFFAVGETSLPRLFQTMVLTHTGVGLLLATLMIFFFALHLPAVWRRRHRESIVSGAVFLTVGVVLVVTGLFILTAAASRDNRWAWWAHVIAALLVPAGYAVHRLVSYVRPPRQRARRFGVAVGAVCVLLIGAHAFTKRDIELTPEAQAARAAGLDTGPGARARDVARFVEGPFVPRGLVPPESPFFPSAATTTSGGHLPARIITRGDAAASADRIAREAEERGFVVDVPIGAETCVRCHPDTVEQWEASAHRFASFNNPFYEATINDMRTRATEPNEWVLEHMDEFDVPADGVGRVKSKWCSGCHDPALMLAGQMDAPIDRRSVEAQAGLTCLACHAIDAIHDQTGNGNYNIADEQEDPYLFSDAPTGSWGAFLHDAAVKAKPTVHMRQMLKPFHSEPEFCATCHKVSLSEPVNNYRWLRGQDEYDAWHDSGVSGNASRTFYLPETFKICQDCHMPLEDAPLGDVAAKDGQVRSHRFLAVNTALPYVRGDSATIRRIERFLRDEKLSVDIFALRTSPDVEPAMAIDRAAPRLSPGDRVTFDVVVRNRGVGHTFPGGTNDSNEGWLQFTVEDEEGRILARSGAVGDDGHLDPMAHVFKAVILDREGNPIQRRNAQDIHVTAAVNVIGPGTADVAHYELSIPPGWDGRRLTVRARLLWRKFDRAYAEFAYRTNPDGFTRFGATPELPITEIAADEITLVVGDVPEAGRAAGDGPAAGEGPAGGDGSTGGNEPAPGPRIAPDEWTRYNDYGIGLLLQGNTRAALRPFGWIAENEPDRIDGPRNLARVALAAGNLEAAYERLLRAEEIRPGDPQTAWVWGGVLQEDGRYTEAEQAYRRVLEVFPEDRAAWFQLGRTLYLDRRHEEALVALDKVLEIDPEHREAHYHRMLSLRALGRTEEAAIAEAAFERYRVDEAASALTGEFRARNPGVNLMALPIHTHTLEIEEVTEAAEEGTP